MKKIIMYSTPTCHYCDEAKKFFDEKGLRYSVINVAADLEKRKEMIEKSGQMGVPVIIIKGKVVVGFTREKMEEALK